MAEVTFVGAAGTVTGSKHLIAVDGKFVFVDCGLFQGTKDVTALNDVPLPVAPGEIDAVVVTHGHIDHVGYLPKLVRDGFRGSIYSTPPTRALMGIVLEDAANLQAHLSKRGMHHESYAPPAYYGEADVQRTLQMTKTQPLGKPFDVCGITATYQNAGHIIGSAFVQMRIGSRQVVFSGDLGRYGRPLLYDPAPMGDADVLFCESTYGNRLHPPDAQGDLERALVAGIKRGGAIVIPAFAVERSQDLLLSIAQLQASNPAIAGVPVYLDSPMAAKVDDVFERFPDAHKPIPLDAEGRPFGCRVTVTVETDASKALNHLQGPRIIVSASGMAAGGRVLHHIFNNIGDSRATLLFVGYQSVGTLGNYLLHGAQTARLFGDTIPVRATIAQISGYSAHADYQEIQQWFDTCQGKPEFYAIHGDPDAAEQLCKVVEAKYGWQAQPAARGKTVTV